MTEITISADSQPGAAFLPPFSPLADRVIRRHPHIRVTNHSIIHSARPLTRKPEEKPTLDEKMGKIIPNERKMTTNDVSTPKRRQIP
jgi:hypothetical protein